MIVYTSVQGEFIEEDGVMIVQKPYAVDELGHKVREVLDSRYAK